MKKKNNQFKCSLVMAGEEAVLRIEGIIGLWESPIDFTGKVQEAVNAGAKSLRVQINSLGGYCYDGLAMAAALKNSGLPTVGEVIGTAQSMASYILQTCDRRIANDGATLMFHQPQGGCCGTVEDMEEEARNFRTMRENMFALMAARSNIWPSAVAMDEDLKRGKRVFTAQEALDAGLLDEITGAAPVDAPEGTPEPVEAPRRVQFGEAWRAALGDDPEDEDPEEPETKDPEEPETPEETPEEPETPEETPEEPETPEETPEEPETPEETPETPEEPEKPETPEDEAPADKCDPEKDRMYSQADFEQALRSKEQAMLASLGCVAAEDLPGAFAPGMTPGTPGTQQPGMANLDTMSPLAALDFLMNNPGCASQYVKKH